jgi:CRISPR type I-E-associated protein CasB/Cse2
MSENQAEARQEHIPNPWELRRQAVNKLGAAIGHAEFPAGDLAALRKLDQHKAYPPAYWRLLTNPERVPQTLTRGKANETAWALIMQTMAIMAPGCHQPGLSLGRVLAGMDQGTMETRLMKLLSSRGDAVWDQIRFLARMLANQGLSIDFSGLADLLLSPEGSERERARNAIARDFFAAQYKKDQIQAGPNQ